MKAKPTIKPLPYKVKRYLKEVEKYTETEAKRLSALLVNHKEEAEISEDIKEQLRTFKSYCKTNKEIKFKDGLTLKTLKSLELKNIEFILDNIINRKIIETQALNDLLINMIKEKVPACIIELIISAGAKTDTTDENGKTALDIAIEHGKTDCINLLEISVAKSKTPVNPPSKVAGQGFGSQELIYI